MIKEDTIQNLIYALFAVVAIFTAVMLFILAKQILAGDFSKLPYLGVGLLLGIVSWFKAH